MTRSTLIALALACALPAVGLAQNPSAVFVSPMDVFGRTITPMEPPQGTQAAAHDGAASTKETDGESTPPEPPQFATWFGGSYDWCNGPDDGAPRIRSRLSVRREFGDGPGFDSGYTYLEGFIPLFQQPGEWIFFGNLRAVNFDRSDLWEFNGGGGVRRLNQNTCRILGAYVNYDGRTSISDRFFNQVMFGVESLGRYLDFRANFYFPVGEDSQLVGLANPHFRGYNIVFDGISEVALRGFDMEVGTPVPFFQRWDTRAFIGYYHYSHEGVQPVNGIRGRVEANINDRLSLYASLQNDGVFDTTFHGGLALHFGPGRSTRSGFDRDMAYRLGDRVVRDPNIMTTQGVSDIVATDVKTGNPIIVRHANSNAPADGDGTVEHPYQTLTQLQGGSQPSEILFAHAGSVFNKQSIVLQDGQRFLGEGVDHTFVSQQGTFLLPRATSNTALPIMQDSPGLIAVTLASNTEVAGFDIRNPAGDAIKGGTPTPIENVIIRNNAIVTGGNFDGIELDNVTGKVIIENNVITKGTGKGNEGIDIFLGGASAGDYTIRNNTITKPDDSGILVFLQDNAVFNGVVSGNTVTKASNGGQLGDDRGGISFQLNNNAQARASIIHNTVVDTAANPGIKVLTTGTSLGFFQVAGNTVNQAVSNAILTQTQNTSQLNVQIQANTVNRNIQLTEGATSVLQFEDVLGSNILQGGAVVNQTGTPTAVPAGTFGFPPP